MITEVEQTTGALKPMSLEFMSESKHTPGPWCWWTSNSWKRLKRDERGVTMNVLEPYVCRDGHPDCSVSDADMALIAAAPDLLEVLQYIVETAPTVTRGDVERDARARAAIAKAIGHE
jgi:hypothetical protein